MNLDERVAKLTSGSEPEFQSTLITQDHLAISYSWYAQNKDKKDAATYLTQYCKKHNITASASQINRQVSTLGFTARMLMRGAVLPDASMKWFNGKLKAIATSRPTLEDLIEDNAEEEKPKKTVQDYLTEQVTKALGDLDGLIDQLILTHFKIEEAPTSILLLHNLKGAHVPKIVDYYKRQRDEIRIALERTDSEVVEAYSGYYRPNLKKLETFLDRIIGDALQLQSQAVSARAPRKKKFKSPDKLTAKLKYSEGIPDLNIKSIAPAKIIDAQGLWVYNTKTRKLGLYVADDRRGLSLKGQTILNYIEKTSRAKKIRKPELVLPKVVTGGKVVLKGLLASIRAVETPLSGRINKDTVLLRVINY